MFLVTVTVLRENSSGFGGDCSVLPLNSLAFSMASAIQGSCELVMWALVLVEFVTSVRKESACKLGKFRAENKGWDGYLRCMWGVVVLCPVCRGAHYSAGVTEHLPGVERAQGCSFHTAQKLVACLSHYGTVNIRAGSLSVGPSWALWGTEQHPWLPLTQ